jgi:fucose 4-O-acetylase-like acetyltransferase
MPEHAKTVSGRIEWLDYAKGVGIILVVLGHSIYGLRTEYVSSRLNFYLSLDFLIYSFHMPLFFFVSGALFSSRSTLSVSRFARASFIGLVVPYVLWSAAFVVLQQFDRSGVNHLFTLDQLANIWRKPIAHMWFIYALFFVQIAFYFGRQIAGTAGMVVVACVCAFSYLAHSNYSVDAIVAGTAMGGTFFALGYAATCEPGLSKWKDARWPLFVIGALVWAASLAVKVHWSTDIPTPIAAAGGVLAAVSLCFMLPPARGALAILALIGQASISIYVAHTLFAASLRILLYKFHIFDCDLHVISETLLGLAAPTVLFVVANRLAISPYIGFGPVRRTPYLSLVFPSLQKSNV